MKKIKHTLKEIVFPPNVAQFYFIRGDDAFYTIELEDNTIYQFPISISDMKGATFSDRIKAITLMRWIRKSMETENLVKIRERK